MSCIYLKTEENRRKRNGRGAHPYLQTSNSSRFHCADKETDRKVIKRLGTESQKRKVYRVSVKCFFNFVENKILQKKKIMENRGWNESKRQIKHSNYSFLGKCASLPRTWNFRPSGTRSQVRGINIRKINCWSVRKSFYFISKFVIMST